ncbi:unnamed protein product [Amoebophrya sp. A25]|nr:unnamed protein product [Amoebophrya sp. A25]|eukprot:GSA25T00016717001.1
MWPPILDSIPPEGPPTPPLIKDRRTAETKKAKEDAEEKRRHELERRAWERERRMLMRKIQTLEKVVSNDKLEKMESAMERRKPKTKSPSVQIAPRPRPEGAMDQEALERRPRDPPIMLEPECVEPFPNLKEVERKSPRSPSEGRAGSPEGRAEKTIRMGKLQDFDFREELKVMNNLRMGAYSNSLWDAFYDWQHTMNQPSYTRANSKSPSKGGGSTRGSPAKARQNEGSSPSKGTGGTSLQRHPSSSPTKHKSSSGG